MNWIGLGKFPISVVGNFSDMQTATNQKLSDLSLIRYSWKYPGRYFEF